MTPETVERVARAIWAAQYTSPFDEAGLDEERSLARQLARTAISALRDPPMRLVAAALDDHDKRGGRQGYTDAWNAMIDAALKEGAPNR